MIEQMKNNKGLVAILVIALAMAITPDVTGWHPSMMLTIATQVVMTAIIVGFGAITAKRAA